jgi:hypothetical protein
MIPLTWLLCLGAPPGPIDEVPIAAPVEPAVPPDVPVDAPAVAADDPRPQSPSAPDPSADEAIERRVDARLRELGFIDARGRRVPPATPRPTIDPRFAPRREAFLWGDFTWAPANYAPVETPLKWGPFTGEIRLDAAYHVSLANPKDNTISGSSEVFRHNELQLTQIGFGGNVFYRNVHARLMTQFGMYSVTTPRNDSSYARGNWRLDDAYRHLSEAYAGYHIPVRYGLNVQAGIFMSYVGLWSYYNFDNWTYQPSYVSSNTPWFFNGVRVQFFPTKRLKLEPWIVNGWQAYAKFGDGPGFGGQVLWRPTEWLTVLGNQYYGTDTFGVRARKRIHTDDSIMIRTFERPARGVSRGAVSLTLDAGCEWGGGVSCGQQYFAGFMAYHRLWFWRNQLGLTVGGGAITNPGRYLVLIPPINGATAASGTPYFTAAPGNRYWAWDLQTTFDWMINRHLTLRGEFTTRHASVPYFSGRDGVTPPGGNQGPPGSIVPGWRPDLVRDENRFTLAWMLRY